MCGFKLAMNHNQLINPVILYNFQTSFLSRLCFDLVKNQKKDNKYDISAS